MTEVSKLNAQDALVASSEHQDVFHLAGNPSFSVGMVSIPTAFIDALSRDKTEPEIRASLARAVQKIAKVERASLTVPLEDGTMQVHAIGADEHDVVKIIPMDIHLPIDRSLTGRTYTERRLWYVSDTSSTAETFLDAGMLARSGINSCLSIPLISGEQCFGCLNVGTRQKDGFALVEIATFTHLTRWAAAEIELRRHKSQLDEMLANTKNVLDKAVAGDFDVRVPEFQDEHQMLSRNVNRLLAHTADVIEEERMKSEFISVISHELRTPLAAIRGALGLLSGTIKSTLPERGQELIDIASKNSERLIILINDILDIEKIASGNMEFNYGEHSARTLVETAVQTIEPLITELKSTVEIREIDPNITMRVDEARIMQILINFVSNSAKYSPEGGRIIVHGDLNTHKGSFRISVSDDGYGISRSTQHRVFSKFWKGDGRESRKASGSGLGLHISKQLTELMGGSIGFTSAEGVGSTFWIEFTSSTSGAITTQKTGWRAPSDFSVNDTDLSSKPRILFVEDDHDLTSIMRETLGDGAITDCAPTLEDAERFLCEATYDLIVLDIDLRGENGLSLLDQDFFKKDTAPLVVVYSASLPPQSSDHKIALTMIKSVIDERQAGTKIMDILKG